MSKELIDTGEPILIVQIAIGIMLLSWVIAPITAIINYLIDANLDGYAGKIFILPLILVALFTLNGTPTKKKWIDTNDS